MTDTRTLIINDVTLRDGMHALSHQYDIGEMVRIAAALDAAGVDIIEVSHGDGLGGNALNYGFSRHPEFEYLSAVAGVLTQAKLAALLLPGIGTIRDLKAAIPCGISVVRIASHCTEADITQQHIEYTKNRGLEAVGFLMMSHMIPPAALAEQARLMEGYGADCVYVVDSAGALLMQEVAERIDALKQALRCQVGYHAHNNLGLGVANSIVAAEHGADRIDASLVGLGAGAGNAQLEVFVAVALKQGLNTRCNLYALIDAADQLVRPMLEAASRTVRIDGRNIALGFAGVYSSFLLHAQRAAERFGIDARDILLELGRRKMVGGQEDMIVDVALDMTRKTL
jgi:4-hydroxy 2-oxovalerate aldolase